MSETTVRVRIRGRYRLHVRVIADPSAGLTHHELGELVDHLGHEARAWIARKELEVDTDTGEST